MNSLWILICINIMLTWTAYCLLDKKIEGVSNLLQASRGQQSKPGFIGKATTLCHKCRNERCPKAGNHRYKCTWSNSIGQIGELEEKE